MRSKEEILADASLDELITIQELAAILQVSYVRAAAIVQDLNLPCRYATEKEEGELQKTNSSITGEKRVKGLPPKQPGARIKLVCKNSVSRAQGRDKPGWKRGEKRKRGNTP